MLNLKALQIMSGAENSARAMIASRTKPFMMTFQARIKKANPLKTHIASPLRAKSLIKARQVLKVCLKKASQSLTA